MGKSLTIDRIDLADTAQADQLASLLIAQLAPQLERLLPLPIEDVARACGILEIRPLKTEGFEGGLIQDLEKEHGFILVKEGARADRTRFTIAHELGHFVNLRHVAAPGTAQLLCSREDMRTSGTTQTGRHGMEAQANEFAASLLMPTSIIASQAFMKGSPEIGRILALQALCGVSKEAAARRYVELHGDDFAVVFTKDGKLIRFTKTRDFPWLDLRAGQQIHVKTQTRSFEGDEGDLSEQDEVDSYLWLSSQHAKEWELWEEVLVQTGGYRMTLLAAERVEDD
jgi:hypothetical protein